MANAFYKIGFIDRNVYSDDYTLNEQVQQLLDMLADTLSADIFISSPISYINAQSIAKNGNVKNSLLKTFINFLDIKNLPRSIFTYDTGKEASDNMRIKHTTDIKLSIERKIQYKNINQLFSELSQFIKNLEEFGYNYRITKYVYYNDW